MHFEAKVEHFRALHRCLALYLITGAADFSRGATAFLGPRHTSESLADILTAVSEVYGTTVIRRKWRLPYLWSSRTGFIEKHKDAPLEKSTVVNYRKKTIWFSLKYLLSITIAVAYCSIL